MSSIRPLAPASSPHPSLQDFSQAADRALATGNDTGTTTLAIFGASPDSNAAPTWLREGPCSTHMFIAALRQSFGDSLAAAIARELSLDSPRDRALSPQDVRRGIKMGENAQAVLEGVDFVTRQRVRTDIERNR